MKPSKLHLKVSK